MFQNDCYVSMSVNINQCSNYHLIDLVNINIVTIQRIANGRYDSWVVDTIRTYSTNQWNVAYYLVSNFKYWQSYSNSSFYFSNTPMTNIYNFHEL